MRGGWDETFSTQNGMATLDAGGLNTQIVLAVLNSSNTVILERLKIQNGGWGISAAAKENTTIRQSVITGNKTGLWSHGPVYLQNSTISGNTNDGAAGINVYGGPLIINNSTITNNTATVNGGGIYVTVASPPVSITVKNSIISGNISGGSGANCVGPMSSGGNNIIGRGCSMAPLANDLVDNDIQFITLLPGGYSMPIPGNPAIDNGNPAVPGNDGNACEGNDQVGKSRPVDGDGDGNSVCDIGAMEYSGGGGYPVYFNPYKGTYRLTNPGKLMGIPLGTSIMDANGNGVAGVEVTFTAPSSGVEGNFY